MKVKGFYGEVDITGVGMGSVISYYNRTFKMHYDGIVLGADPNYNNAFQVVMLTGEHKPKTDWSGKVMIDTAFYGNLTGVVEMPKS